MTTKIVSSIAHMVCFPEMKSRFSFPAELFFFVFFQHSFWITPFPLYTTYFDPISLYIYTVSWNIFYHTKSKVAWKTFKSNFTWRCNSLLKKVIRLSRLISNISFIPVEWPRRDVGNSSRESSDLFFVVYFSLNLNFNIYIAPTV